MKLQKNCFPPHPEACFLGCVRLVLPKVTAIQVLGIARTVTSAVGGLSVRCRPLTFTVVFDRGSFCQKSPNPMRLSLSKSSFLRGSSNGSPAKRIQLHHGFLSSVHLSRRGFQLSCNIECEKSITKSRHVLLLFLYSRLFLKGFFSFPSHAELFCSHIGAQSLSPSTRSPTDITCSPSSTWTTE